MSSAADLHDAYGLLCKHELEETFATEVPPREAIRWEHDFAAWAHPHQQSPLTADNGEPWTTWLVLGGRGAGKTRHGAEWVRALVHGASPYAEHGHLRIALVGENEHDVREVMIEGASGLLRMSPRAERPAWISSRRRLEWENGAVAQAFSADEPESLRGPQFDAVWCDELAKWRYAEAAFDTLQFALRLGERPRQLITTTPRPTPLIRRLLADPRTAVTRAATYANRLNLSPVFLDAVVARYAGTRLGRQEVDGELIEDRPDALWTRAMIEQARVAAAPPLQRIVIGIAAGVRAAGRRRLRHRGGRAGRRRLRLRAGGRDRRGTVARRLGHQSHRALPKAQRRQARCGGQPGRRHGARRAPRGGSLRAAANRARHAR